MSWYNHHGNKSIYYDPVGSHADQPKGYSYQTTGSTQVYQNAPSSSSYGTSGYPNSEANSHSNQRYGSSRQQTSCSTSNATAAALSSLSGTQSYDQASSTSTANNNSRYSNTASNADNNMQHRNDTESPLYSSTQSSSTLGRMSMPEQSQSSSTTYGATQPTYNNASSDASVRSSSYLSAYTQQQQQQSQPLRYNSPLHAMQAQHGHRQQVSQTSNRLPSPQMANATHQNGLSSASVEPSATTVDPSQVYDNRADLQCQAQIDAEKRWKYEAEQAAWKAGGGGVAEEARKRAVEESKEKADPEAVKKGEEQACKNEQRQKPREDKNQSKNTAPALQRLSSGARDALGLSDETDEEAEMRAMFQKMREFNAKNPAMLAKLWEEERTSHKATKTLSTTAQAVPTSKADPASSISNAGGRATKSAASPPSKAAYPAPQMLTPQPLRPSLAPTTTTSLWPPHKKGALAEVITKWLMSLSSNVGNPIESEDVREILDSNPSYVQLCESLEAFGMQFDRSTLARELLKDVPDGLKTQAAPAISTEQPGSAVQASWATPTSPKSRSKGKQRAIDRPSAASSTAVATVEYEAPSSLADVAQEVNAMHKPSFQSINAQESPHFAEPFSLTDKSVPQSATALNLQNASRASSSAAPSDVKPIIRPAELRRRPADKEEAARKRTFGDLVDLTVQDDSDDDGQPPKKIMIMTKSPDAQTVGDIRSQQRDPMFFLKQSQAAEFRNFATANINGNGQRVDSCSTQRQQQTNEYQSSNTPSQQRPVLPPEPAQISAKAKGPTPAQVQQSRMSGKLLVEPIIRDRAARKTTYDSRTIARDVLLATGRHPDMRGLNAHLNVMQKLLGQHGLDSDGGNRSDLATIRWDVIDPEPSKKPTKEDTEIKGSEYQANGTPNSKPHPLQSSPRLHPLKKRGRPRIYKVSPDPLTNPTLGTAAADTSTSNRQSASTSRPATPSLNPNMSTITPSSGPIGYSAFQQLDVYGKKKKGRPFGWRKDIHSRAAQGLEPATNPARKVPKPPAKPVAPDYQVYKCEWCWCKSELHNADVLKKHVVKVHGKADKHGGLFCEWDRCEDRDRRWGGLEEWLKHVDAVHLAPIRWKLGDGPREVDSITFRETAQIPPYLNDARGRSVTPVISPPPPPTSNASVDEPSSSHDVFRSSSSPRPQSKTTQHPHQHPAMLIHTHPAKSQSQPLSARVLTKSSFDAELQELERHQRLIVPTMGRMGCVLANEERREGWLDDEDFEEEVEGEEHGGMEYEDKK